MFLILGLIVAVDGVLGTQYVFEQDRIEEALPFLAEIRTALLASCIEQSSTCSVRAGDRFVYGWFLCGSYDVDRLKRYQTWTELEIGRDTSARRHPASVLLCVRPGPCPP